MEFGEMKQNTSVLEQFLHAF